MPSLKGRSCLPTVLSESPYLWIMQVHAEAGTDNVSRDLIVFKFCLTSSAGKLHSCQRLTTLIFARPRLIVASKTHIDLLCSLAPGPCSGTDQPLISHLHVANFSTDAPLKVRAGPR
jgi:hypothetical protein